MKVGDIVKRRPVTFHEYGESGDGKAPRKAMTTYTRRAGITR